MNLKKQLLFYSNYFTVAQLFLSLSLTFGTWVIYIPIITQKLGMSKGDLGIALFASAIGSLIAIFIGKRLISKIGEGRLSMIGVVSMTIFIFSYFLANSFLQLLILMFCFGLTSGILQIGLNTVVSTIEKRDGVSIMSSCHAYFSLGGMIAAGFGTLLLILLDNPLLHIGIAVGIVLVMQVFSYKGFLYLKSSITQNTSQKKQQTHKSPRLWALAIIAVAAMVSEGAIADWSSLYLRDVALAPETTLGLGYAAFSLTMTIGRFVGDYFSQRLGPLQILLNGFYVAIIGLILVLFATPLISLIGFSLIGAGFSILVPEAYRLSTHIDGIAPSTGIAFMAGAGYLGFLGGPVALGAIAEQSGLHTSFFFILGLVIAGMSTSLFLKQKHAGKLRLNLPKVFTK